MPRRSRLQWKMPSFFQLELAFGIFSTFFVVRIIALAEQLVLYTSEVIPDGFYLVADALNSQLDFQKAVIESVRQVTHIAPPDGNGNIIDEPIVTEGVISVPVKKLGLCCSVTGGTYVTTTEVYPDSPNASDEICNHAQVAAITGALEFIRSSQQ